MHLIAQDDICDEGAMRVAGRAFLNKLKSNEATEIGTILLFDDGHIELLTGAYPTPGIPMHLRLDKKIAPHRSPIAAIIEIDDRPARFEIGEATFFGQDAKAIFFGTPAFEARIILSEGLRSLPVPNRSCN